MIGPLVDSGSLAVGGIIGVLFGRLLPVRVKDSLPLIFGVITISIGATLVGKAVHFPVVVMALIMGAVIGEMLYFEKGLEKAIRFCMTWSRKHDQVVDDNFIVQYVTLISAFCFGSMGLFGAVEEGITGVPGLLITKAVLDLFCGIIFGAAMGIRVSFIAVPQFLILAGLYLVGSLFLSSVSPATLGNFNSTGGVIFLATGLRMCGIKIFPVVNMLPALAVVLPLTALWVAFMPG